MHWLNRVERSLKQKIASAPRQHFSYQHSRKSIASRRIRVAETKPNETKRTDKVWSIIVLYTRRGRKWGAHVEEREKARQLLEERVRVAHAQLRYRCRRRRAASGSRSGHASEHLLLRRGRSASGRQRTDTEQRARGPENDWWRAGVADAVWRVRCAQRFHPRAAVRGCDRVGRLIGGLVAAGTKVMLDGRWRCRLESCRVTRCPTSGRWCRNFGGGRIATVVQRRSGRNSSSTEWECGGGEDGGALVEGRQRERACTRVRAVQVQVEVQTRVGVVERSSGGAGERARGGRLESCWGGRGKRGWRGERKHARGRNDRVASRAPHDRLDLVLELCTQRGYEKLRYERNIDESVK